MFVLADINDDMKQCLFELLEWINLINDKKTRSI